MKKEDFKIITLSDSKNNRKITRRKRDWIKITTIVGGIATCIGVIIAAIAIIVDIKLDEKTEVQYKPLVDISIEYNADDYLNEIYLGETEKYISNLLITSDGEHAEVVNVTIEPFYNIIYYNQKEGFLIKQLLPISDLDGISELYAPLNINNISMKRDNICEILLNTNTYKIIENMMYLFENTEIQYNDYFYNILPETIITSVDFEYYITIEYMDIYENNYTDIYLCETGFRNFSGYLSDFAYESDPEKIPDDMAEYNLECMVEYVALKVHNIENFEFNAKLSKIPEDDIFYDEYHTFISKLRETPGTVMYIPNMIEDLDVLISYGYNNKQLIFYVDEENKEWTIYK